jgi:hypothetical protein
MKRRVIIGLVATLVLSIGATALAVEQYNATFDVDWGTVTFTERGIDTSTLHPGQVGTEVTVALQGGYTGAAVGNLGNYGALQSHINVAAKSAGADFQVWNTDFFNVLSGNHTYNVVGQYYLHASGGDDRTALNCKIVPSMYVDSVATNPYWLKFLQGNVVEAMAATTKGGTLNSYVYVNLIVNDIAWLYNTNIWWAGNTEGAITTTNYSGGTREAHGTGGGSMSFDSYGANGAEGNINWAATGGSSTGVDGFGRPTIFFGDKLDATYYMKAW